MKSFKKTNLTKFEDPHESRRITVYSFLDFNKNSASQFISTLRTCLIFYRVVKLLQSGKREETMHADSVFNQQLDKVHAVQD